MTGGGTVSTAVPQVSHENWIRIVTLTLQPSDNQNHWMFSARSQTNLLRCSAGEKKLPGNEIQTVRGLRVSRLKSNTK